MQPAAPALSDLIDALMIARHLGGCAWCREQHGDFPASVSCYCGCHDGQRERWAAIAERWKTLEAQYLGPMPDSVYDKS